MCRGYNYKWIYVGQCGHLYLKMVSPTGFEPVTCPLGGGRAIQLCHGDIKMQACCVKRNEVYSEC